MTNGDYLLMFVGFICWFICGYCFGRADGIRKTSNMWQEHITSHIDPYIKFLKERFINND